MIDASVMFGIHMTPTSFLLRDIVTKDTTKNHMSSILGKLGVRDRTQAVLKAKELGLG